MSFSDGVQRRTRSVAFATTPLKSAAGLYDYRTKHPEIADINCLAPAEAVSAAMDKVALIVEDEFLIVLELEELLNGAGYESVFSHSTVASALSWLETNRADLAVIDYRLRDATSEAIVDRLIETAIPTLIYSGAEYWEDIHRPAMKEFEWVTKPSPPEDLIAAIERAKARGQSRR